MDPLRHSLGRLGLGRHEAAIYAALLERSPAGASWIAKKCGLARSSVYTALQSLADKGLVGTTRADEVKQFVAQGHGALLDYLQKEEERANARVRLAEELRDQFARLGGSPGAQLPQLLYFEGQEGLKRAYLSMLRAARAPVTLCILRDEFVYAPEWSFVFERPWRERVKRLKAEKEVTTLLLVNRSRLERSKAAYYRGRPHLTHRYLPRGHSVSRFALYTAGDVALILSMEVGSLVGITIANAHLAANMASVFQALWSRSR